MSEAQLKYFNLLNLLYQCSFGRLQPSRGHVQSLLEWNVDSKNCDSMIDKLIYDRYVKEEGETITITELGIEIFKGMQLDLERERINALEIKTEERDKIVFFFNMDSRCFISDNSTLLFNEGISLVLFLSLSLVSSL